MEPIGHLKAKPHSEDERGCTNKFSLDRRGPIEAAFKHDGQRQWNEQPTGIQIQIQALEKEKQGKYQQTDLGWQDQSSVEVPRAHGDVSTKKSRLQAAQEDWRNEQRNLEALLSRASHSRSPTRNQLKDF